MKLILALKNKLSSLHRDERGLSTVEYVILLALIAVVGIGVWGKFGDTIMSKVTEADGKIQELGE